MAIVVKDGRPVFRRAYGIADLEFGVLLEPDMVFRIGSVTKQFTAAAILQLADQGKLALDDEVTKYVDGYDTHGRRVTLEHLLTHTSGHSKLHGHGGVVPAPARGADAAPDRGHVRAEPLEFEPGSRFKYSNSAISCSASSSRKCPDVRTPTTSVRWCCRSACARRCTTIRCG